MQTINPTFYLYLCNFLYYKTFYNYIELSPLLYFLWNSARFLLREMYTNKREIRDRNGNRKARHKYFIICQLSVSDIKAKENVIVKGRVVHSYEILSSHVLQQISHYQLDTRNYHTKNKYQAFFNIFSFLFFFQIYFRAIPCGVNYSSSIFMVTTYRW